MDTGDILLGRPWMYHKNGTNGMRGNTHSCMVKTNHSLPYEASTTKERVKFSYHQGGASSAQCLQKKKKEQEEEEEEFEVELFSNLG